MSKHPSNKELKIIVKSVKWFLALEMIYRVNREKFNEFADSVLYRADKILSCATAGTFADHLVELANMGKKINKFEYRK